MASKRESKFDIAIQQYNEELKRAEAKYKRQLKKDPTITPEAFGLSSEMFSSLQTKTKWGRPTIKEVRTRTAQLQEFTDRKYGLKKIGTTIEEGKEKNVYMTKQEWKNAVAMVNAQNRFRTTLAKAIEKAGGYTYARLTKSGIVKEKSNMYNATVAKSSDFIPIRINIKGGKSIGYKGDNLVQETNLTTLTFKEKYGNFGNKATSISDVRIENLKKNWLDGLAKTVNKSFANKIRRKLNELNIDAIDFLGLFHLSSAFDFDFIYDESLTIEKKEEEIKSEIEAFRKDTKRYKAFRKEMEKLD